MLKLYGSTTSPYVRRLRIWLANTEHEFYPLQIFEGQDRDYLASRNPTMKVPMLEDAGEMIFDSRVIYRYLTEKQRLPALSWEQENLLTLIDNANDSLVNLYLLQRSGFDVSEDKLYFRLQQERVDQILEHLNQQVDEPVFAKWDYPSVCLYCLLDWLEFRQLHELAGLDGLLTFQNRHKDRIEVTASDPRN